MRNLPSIMTRKIRLPKLFRKPRPDRRTVDLPEIAPLPKHINSVAVATVFKNEGPFLAEWIDFHRFLGVSEFFLYDNGSTDDSLEVLAPYIAAGIVTVVPWLTYQKALNNQTLAYAHAIVHLGARHRWVGLFDLDEFMFPVARETLVDTLSRLVRLPVVGVLGIHFGTSGHVERPSGLVTESYRKAVPAEKQHLFPKMVNIKCFVQPPLVEASKTAHFFAIRGGKEVAYTEKGIPIMGYPRLQHTEMSAETIRYNHYYTRSLSEFRAKAARSSVRGPGFPIPDGYRQSMFDAIEALAVEDRAIDVHLHAFERWRTTEGRVPGGDDA